MVTPIQFILGCDEKALTLGDTIILAPAYLAISNIIIPFPPKSVSPYCPFNVTLTGAKQNINTTIEPDTTSQIYSFTPLYNLGPNDFAQIKTTAFLSQDDPSLTGIYLFTYSYIVGY